MNFRSLLRFAYYTSIIGIVLGVGVSANYLTGEVAPGDPPTWLIFAALALLAAVIVGSFFLLDPGETATAQPIHEAPIQEKIHRLQESLADSSDLITELNTEIELQVASLERVRAEAQETMQLAELKHAEAEAVKNVVETAVATANRKVATTQAGQQWRFFLLGLLSAIPLGVAGNFVYAWLN